MAFLDKLGGSRPTLNRFIEYKDTTILDTSQKKLLKNLQAKNSDISLEEITDEVEIVRNERFEKSKLISKKQFIKS